MIYLKPCITTCLTMSRCRFTAAAGAACLSITIPPQCCYSQRASAGDGPDDKPVKFSTSPAFKFRPELSYETDSRSRPWIEPYVILISVLVFMIYFFKLREENDIDERLGGRSIECQIRDHEIKQLIKTIEICKTKGLDTTDLEENLWELQNEDSGVN